MNEEKAKITAVVKCDDVMQQTYIFLLVFPSLNLQEHLQDIQICSVYSSCSTSEYFLGTQYLMLELYSFVDFILYLQ